MKTEDGPIATVKAPTLSPQDRYELQDLARGFKGLYVRMMRLCKKLDIPFPP